MRIPRARPSIALSRDRYGILLMKPETAKTALPIRVIEMAGLPGTGKSTVARCLETILGSAGVRTSSGLAIADQQHFYFRQQKKLQLILRHSNGCNKLYRSAFRLIAQSGQRSIADVAIVTSNLWSVIALMAEARTAAQDRVLIADQGLLQAIWSVQLSSTRALSLDTWRPLFLAAGISNTLLVYIQADVSVSRRRIAKRVRGRTRLGLESAEERWQLAAQNMSRLVEWARKTIPHDEPGATVLSVVNHEGAPEAAAAEIANAYFRRCS
jgi:adenylate kinase